MSSHALSAIHHIVIRWIRQVRPVRRSMTNDPVPAQVLTVLPPPALYDPVVHTITCPHCGQALPIAEWTLIESGYARYWSLYLPTVDDSGRVTASDDGFSNNGDDALPRLVHDSHDCYRASLVPENFQWRWD